MNKGRKKGKQQSKFSLTFVHVLQNLEDAICYDLVKQLSHYLYFFSFSFSFGLTTQEGVWESVMSQVSHEIESHRVMSHDKSHDGCKKTVHRLCSSYISSIENLTGTLSSSSCQLRLGVDLSHLG